MSDEKRVIHGGWFSGDASDVRGALRSSDAPARRFSLVGFRCVAPRIEPRIEPCVVRGNSWGGIPIPNPFVRGSCRSCLSSTRSTKILGFRCVAPDPYAGKTREELIAMLRAR